MKGHIIRSFLGSLSGAEMKARGDLEPPGKGWVTLNVAPVLVRGGGSQAVELPACKHYTFQPREGVACRGAGR